ncbi:MAG: hypothetical protein AAGB19_02775 [Cyanobacteria bacterium P01_F01_bin.3]
MAYRFSKRSVKYVWLTLPGLFATGLTGIWLSTVAPSMQHHARTETEWRRERLAAKQRSEFLQDNKIHSDYSQLIFEYAAADQTDLREVISAWYQGDMAKSYAPGQVVRLLDQYHVCIGYLVADAGVYLELDNPELCSASNADTPDKLNKANLSI